MFRLTTSRRRARAVSFAALAAIGMLAALLVAAMLAWKGDVLPARLCNEDRIFTSAFLMSMVASGFIVRRRLPSAIWSDGALAAACASGFCHALAFAVMGFRFGFGPAPRAPIQYVAGPLVVLVLALPFALVAAPFGALGVGLGYLSSRESRR